MADAEDNAGGEAAEGDSPVQKKGDHGGPAKAGGPSQKLVFLVLILNFVVLLAVAVVFF